MEEIDDVGEIVLISECFFSDWEAARQRVRIYPKEAATLPTRNKAESALHWACYNGAPATVIREIAAAGPKMALTVQDWQQQVTLE